MTRFGLARSRESWMFATVETFAQDVSHALRLLRRDPAFTLTTHAAADGGGTHGGMAARAPRHTDRPVRRAARGTDFVSSRVSAHHATVQDI
jgi:hypothetical protein